MELDFPGFICKIAHSAGSSAGITLNHCAADGAVKSGLVLRSFVGILVSGVFLSNEILELGYVESSSRMAKTVCGPSSLQQMEVRS